METAFPEFTRSEHCNSSQCVPRCSGRLRPTIRAPLVCPDLNTTSDIGTPIIDQEDDEELQSTIDESTVIVEVARGLRVYPTPPSGFTTFTPRSVAPAKRSSVQSSVHPHHLSGLTEGTGRIGLPGVPPAANSRPAPRPPAGSGRPPMDRET